MFDRFKGVQRDILIDKGNQLVSAGAGSGKTTIMIEKIADLIVNKKVPINSLLVVTFTVLAAEEMKTRLIDKLNQLLIEVEDKQSVLDLIEQVKTASIDTIDGFSSKTIKKYFYQLQMNPNFNIISDASKDYYLTIAMQKTIEDFSFDKDKINILLDIFGGEARNLDNLQQLILENYNNVINIEDYNAFLQTARQMYQDNNACELVVKQRINHLLNKAVGIAIDNSQGLSNPAQEKLANYLANMQAVIKDEDLSTKLEKVLQLQIPQLSKKDSAINTEIKQSFEIVKKLIKDLQEKGVCANFRQQNGQILQYFDYFLELLLNFIKNYNDLKQKNNLIDFNDLNRLMLKLLKDKKVRQELKNQYKYIFIDEYQDVNPLQDSLMSQLVGEDTVLFTVGDVKQSIYGFRGASPEWFLKKYNDYKQDKQTGTSYDMNVNFRSNPKILQFINQIFTKLMTPATADIDYAKDCNIEPQREDIIDDKVKIVLIKEEEKPTESGVYSVKNATATRKIDGESLYILKEITQLINTPFYDANLKQERKLTYGDMAILSRSYSDDSVQGLIDLLRANAVPVKASSKLDISKNEGVKLIISILKCVTNLADDVDYLATFMALTDLTISQLIDIRDTKTTLLQNLQDNISNKEIQKGFDILNNIKTHSYTNTNSGIIRYILNDAKLRYYLLLKPNGQQTISQIEEFANKISGVEDGLNLAEFILIVESNVSYGSDISSQDKEDSVTIQTIHKSKGLEYPVVFLFNTSKQFNYISDNSSVNFNADLGLGVDYYDTSNRKKQYSIPRFAIKLKNDEKYYKEEMRLLYVALTRAKNKLIITGKYRPTMFEKAPSNNCYANMIFNQFANLVEGENDFTNCIVHLIDKVEPKQKDIQVEQMQLEVKGVDFEYPDVNKFNIPFKNTVTGLNSQHSQAFSFNTRKWLTKETQYNAEEDRALIGTHYHAALQNVNFLARYQKTTDYPDVDYVKIEQAHQQISKLAKGAIKLHQEAEFMMYVPYNKIVESKTQDKVLVQGVVDLIIEFENSITIVDYKFSTLPIGVLKQKYAEQLSLYKTAVEQAFNKKVDHMYIYSINTAELA